jgi:hypothetical protein
MLYCPNCGAEHREGFSTCSDCHSILQCERPANPPNPADNPFIPFRVAVDPRWRDVLAEALKKAKVPYLVVNREDFLFNLSAKVPYTICVRYADFQRAEEALEQEFGTEEELDAAYEAGAFAIPESHESRHEAKRMWDPEEWYPEDATCEIWRADPSELREMVDLSLRFNEIHTRWEMRDGEQILFVLPEDEAQAREIVRQIIESTPPQ